MKKSIFNEIALMLQVLVGMVVPTAKFPSWKVNLLQSLSAESTYTESRGPFSTSPLGANFAPGGMEFDP
jgi:hypothetical protein